MAEEPNIRTEEPIAHLEDADFWDQYKAQILGGFGLVVAAILAFGLYQITEYNRRANSEQAFAAAVTAEEYLEVAASYRGTNPAGNAMLMAAEILAGQAAYAEAEAVLREFIADYRDHPLAPGGYLKLAGVLERQGSTDDALNTLADIPRRFPDSYAAPVAMATEAEIQRALGQIGPATQVLERLVSSYPNSIFAEQAVQTLRYLRATDPNPDEVVFEVQAAAIREAEETVEEAHQEADAGIEETQEEIESAEERDLEEQAGREELEEAEN